MIYQKFYKPNVNESVSIRKTDQDHNLDNVYSETLKKLNLLKKIKMNLDFNIKNIDRTAGAIISNEISKIHGEKGLPKDTLTLNFKGSAGQSFKLSPLEA